ncbi:hypothetical protein [Aquabacterium humicola]|uniref:hypothetical protein n=1 Tax=Aquabacterium humicola TaxID=3237377 RepID=UPI002543297C|nr:hypothetical protein [Rubrivivax pictus]
MKLSTITLEQLSSLTHEVKLPEERSRSPFFKVISYHGEYRYGSGGNADARYIVATATAAHEAWFTEGIVIDFSDLKYEWGDEMEWVLGIAQGGPTGCSFPLVIIVGAKCKPAIQTLIPDEYADFCVESLDDALLLLEQKRRAYRQCLAEWRPRTVKPEAKQP